MTPPAPTHRIGIALATILLLASGNIVPAVAAEPQGWALGPVAEVTINEPLIAGQGPADQQPVLVALDIPTATSGPPRALLVWQSGRGDVEGSALWYSTITFGLDPWKDRYSAPAPLSGLDDGAIESDPTCVRADFGPLCAWTSWPKQTPSPGTGAGPVIRLARYDVVTEHWLPSTSLPIAAGGPTVWQEQPALAVDPQGGVAIAFVCIDPTVIGDHKGGILLSRTSDGTTFLPPIEVSPADNDAAEDSPTVTLAGDRIMVVFRTQDENLGLGEDWDLAMVVRSRADLRPDPAAPATRGLTIADHALGPAVADPDEQQPRFVTSPTGIMPQTGPYLLWTQGDLAYPGHSSIEANPLDLHGGASSPLEVSLEGSRDTADQHSGGWAIGPQLQVLGTRPLVAYRTGEPLLSGLGDLDIILAVEGDQVNIVGDDSSGTPSERRAPPDFGPALLPLPPWPFANPASVRLEVRNDSGGALICWAGERTIGGSVDLDVRCRRWAPGVVPIPPLVIGPSALVGPLLLAVLWAISVRSRGAMVVERVNPRQGRGRLVRSRRMP